MLQPIVSNELVLRAKNIWVRQGSITIGNLSAPYIGKAAIELNSNPNDPDLIIDPFIDAINNVLVVTGALTIYAPNNITVWTRLSSYASAGAT